MNDAHSGWRQWSVGYHNDDGGLFEENGRFKEKHDEWKFGPGDTVGCGVDYAKGQYFFTRNGDLVGKNSFPPYT